MPNKWIEYVKQYAKENNMSYACALTDPNVKSGYASKTPPAKKSSSVEKHTPQLVPRSSVGNVIGVFMGQKGIEGDLIFAITDKFRVFLIDPSSKRSWKKFFLKDTFDTYKQAFDFVKNKSKSTEFGDEILLKKDGNYNFLPKMVNEDVLLAPFKIQKIPYKLPSKEQLETTQVNKKKFDPMEGLLPIGRTTELEDIVEEAIKDVYWAQVPKSMIDILGLTRDKVYEDKFLSQSDKFKKQIRKATLTKLRKQGLDI
jgi:hypothetical protein